MPSYESRSIVPYAHASCQLGRPQSGDSRLISPQPDDTQCPPSSPDTHTLTPETEHLIDYSDARFALVRGACQEVSHTTSRRSGPAKWRRAVEWLIAAGLHPRANATTRRVAEDLAARMDYDTGHVRYCEADMVARTGIPRATLYRHISYLRELGALAWVQHGTRKNRLAAMGLKGWSGTATVYAAVIPPAFDHAMGHTVIGTGYTARIIIDRRDCNTAPKAASKPASPVDNPPVDNSMPEARETPSLTVVKEEGQVDLVGGFNYTSQATRDHESPTRPSIDKNRSSSGTGRHALQVAKDIRIARQVRPLVGWTQREGLRRLAFALRPLIDKGLDAYAIAEYLHGLCSGMHWKPKAPAAYISTALADQEQRATKQQAAADRFEMENCPVGSLKASVGTRIDVMAGVRQGLARYQQACRARGLDDLSDGEQATWNAEADILAFLNGSPA